MTSKSNTAVAPDPASAVVPVSTVSFRDTLYTSRTLILPGQRTLAVAKGRAVVAADDQTALDYLKAHSEFEPLVE